MKSKGQCYYCDHATEVSNTHVHCDRMNRNIPKLDRCVKHKDRNLDKDVINPPRIEKDED